MQKPTNSASLHSCKKASSIKSTAIRSLVVAMSSLLAVSQGYADTGGKKIGDLEIYKAAEGGKVTIMMMLDTSGSMSEPYMKSRYPKDSATACNLVWGTAYNSYNYAAGEGLPYSGANLPYTRYGCQTGSVTKEKRYFAKKVETTVITETQKVYKGMATRNPRFPYSSATGYSRDFTFTATSNHQETSAAAWSSCGADGSKNSGDCTVTSNVVDTSGLTAESGSPVTTPKTTPQGTGTEKNVTLTGSDGYQYTYTSASTTTNTVTTTVTKTTYYFKEVEVVSSDYKVVPDRLTQLKDAIFKLLDTGGLDASKVSIGIGQFSSQSDSSGNFFTDNTGAHTADGKTGKVLVPAALVDATQIAKIKAAVATLEGLGSTPTAAAYAEAGAYMLGTSTQTNATTTTYSGFANSVTASKKDSKYISPITDSKTPSCDGRGIYFLTDGMPNNVKDSTTVMKNALDTKASTFTGSSASGETVMPQGSSYAYATQYESSKYFDNSMPQVGAFSQALRKSDSNPYGSSILTAVVGFGSDFKVTSDVVKELDTPAVDKSTGLPEKKNGAVVYKTNADGTKKKSKFYDCNVTYIAKDGSTQYTLGTDARNACNWGAKTHPSLPGVGGFGEGGFYSAQSSDDVVNSIKTFVDDLNQTIPATPSGTIVIPDDPYRVDSQMAVAYYPTLQADVGNSPAIWAGNMKKYSLNEGTLWGKSDTRLFKDVAGTLNPDAEDLWSSKNNAGANNEVTAGGLSSNLVSPKDAVQTTRKLYIEDKTDDKATTTTTKLRLLAVDSAGKVTLDGDALSDTHTFNDKAVYTEPTVDTDGKVTDEGTIRKLIKFLGFNTLPTDGTLSKDLTLKKATGEIKVLGASIHSTPAAVSYYAELDDNGRVLDKRDDYMLFGSSDGALHLINADNAGTGDGGKEKFAFIPKELIQKQSNALLPDGKSDKGMGKPYFGIDAPWLVSADYKYDTAGKKVTIDTSNSKGMYAYGGLRMGGEALYGMNLNDKENPSLMFTITPSTTGFDRMGQIWSKPTKARIKNGSTITDVIIFGGGYDMKYEGDNYVPSSTDVPKGNAVYIVNAKDGSLIWSASGSGSPTKSVTTMTNSIVGGITALDRNNDGYMDHLYFADLGGQVFRADFTNGTSFANKRVTRVLEPKYTDKYAFRFYERPVVSFYRNPVNQRLLAMVNVISGDRSSPLSKIRDNNDYADRLYGIIDNDVTQPDSVLYADDFSATALDLKDTNLAKLPDEMGTTAADITAARKAAVINSMQTGTKLGWYYPLTRFDGFSGVKYSKGVGKSEVINSFLFTSVYNPDMKYTSVDPCTAQLTGGTEREVYCLPYGICTDATSLTGTGGFTRAGQGIQELTLGPRSSTLTNQRLLIGTRTLDERASDRRVAYNADGSKKLSADSTDKVGLDQTGLTSGSTDLGDGSAAEFIFNERYTMTPRTWYEVNK